MGLETGNYVADLVITNPPGTDPKSQGDDHLRLIKTTLRNTFPGFTGTAILTGIDTGAANAYVLTPTTPLLAYSAGMVVEFVAANSSTAASTINISGLGAKSILSVDGVALTVSDIIAGQPVLLLYDGASFRLSAITKRYADQLAFSATLPNQAGNGGRLLGTDGSNTSWTNLINTGVMLLSDSVSPTKRTQFVLAGITAGQTRTATMPDRNVLLGANMVLDSRTANTQLVAADAGKLIRITGAGGFTQTFDTFANLAANWWVRIWNASNGNITIPSSDGLTNWIMYPSEARDFQCDGAQLTSIVLKPYRVRFLASGTWNKPPGYSKHRGIVASGGCSGSKSSAGTFAAAGPGGGAFPFEIADSVLGAAETVTVGAGGAAQTVASTDGNSGGTSSFGNWISVIGGIAAPGSGGPIGGAVAVTLGGTTLVASSASRATGFEAATATSAASGASDGIWSGSKGDNAGANNSGNSVYGGAAGGSVAAAGTVRAPGVSRLAGNGGAASSAGNGTAGTFPCGGGGATQTGAQSGAGANGYVDVEGAV